MTLGIDPLSLTKQLVRFDTINPPGQEGECAHFVGSLLEDAGFQVAAYEFEEGRPSIVACLKGEGNNPPICFTGHLDTVATDLSNPWIRGITCLVEEVTGAVVETRGATYFTDAGVLTPAYDHAPTVILGPGEASMAHKVDQYCLISSCTKPRRSILPWPAGGVPDESPPSCHTAEVPGGAIPEDTKGTGSTSRRCQP